ncbi:MAG: chemotaxis protein CheV [Saccharospirillaceae bacterium]|nr:chemotaxis protein [Pseudomonadales bacterium]NRB79494.1 chemotaxis protein CheV [Saccharospirillaceae bacterium]
MNSKANFSQGLLLFSLKNNQQFAIGTLKIRELIPYQNTTKMLNSNPAIKGMLNTRGNTIPIIDMAAVIGIGQTNKEELSNSFIIITDCQRKLVGFIVSHIDKIIETDWKSIQKPNNNLGDRICITGTVEIEKKIIQLMDVEILINRLFPDKDGISTTFVTDIEREKLKPCNILIVDDSVTARKQLTDLLDQLNIPCHVTDNGIKALEIMKEQASLNTPINILVSDIEMPGLDGYELTFEVRSTPSICDAYIILHTSLSSEISVSQAKQVGANEALTKFNAKELVTAMLRGI